MLEHPAVFEVAVVASADEMRGMVPKAFVVLRGTHRASDELKKELQDFVRGELAPHKFRRRMNSSANLRIIMSVENFLQLLYSYVCFWLVFSSRARIFIRYIEKRFLDRSQHTRCG